MKTHARKTGLTVAVSLALALSYLTVGAAQAADRKVAFENFTATW